MKKIALALCACAFALTGLLVSCSNESNSSNYENVGYTNGSRAFAVKGTITSTTTETGKYVVDEYGIPTPNKNGKVSSITSKTEEKVNNGVINVSWSTNENRESNYTTYKLKGSYSGTASGSETSVVLGKDGDSSSSSSSFSGVSLKTPFNENFIFYNIDDVYYIDIENEMIKLDDFAISEDYDALDGSFDDEFTLNLKFTKDMTFEDYAGSDFNYTGDLDKTVKYEEWEDYKEAGCTASATYEYKLTFFPLQDFDPEAEIDEE